MSKYIASLISEGEHQQLDFKHSIGDSRKIARSLVAFANTLGGKLLLGVKDNGKVVGVNSDEEYYMVETASHLFCRPEVPFDIKRWEVNTKVVLEVSVKPYPKTLHKAPDKNGRYKVFFRVKDENIRATPLQVKVWNAKRKKQSIHMALSGSDEMLVNFIQEHKRITVDEYSRLGFMPRAQAEERLINLTALGVVDLRVEGGVEVFVSH